jgi:hypothetical protein
MIPEIKYQVGDTYLINRDGKPQLFEIKGIILKFIYDKWSVSYEGTTGFQVLESELYTKDRLMLWYEKQIDEIYKEQT